LLPVDLDEDFLADDFFAPVDAFLAEDFAALLRAGAAFLADDLAELFLAELFLADDFAPPLDDLEDDFEAEDFEADLPLEAFAPDDFDDEDLELEPFELDFLAGTFSPSLLASERPIAIACFLLVTFLPEPVFSVPRLNSCISSSTFSCDFLPYLAMFASLLTIMIPRALHTN
jgi:hypothetical protein